MNPFLEDLELGPNGNQGLSKGGDQNLSIGEQLSGPQQVQIQ